MKQPKVSVWLLAGAIVLALAKRDAITDRIPSSKRRRRRIITRLVPRRR